MTLDPTAAFVTVVAADRTIHLPADVPVGATVAVVLLPSRTTEAESARREWFERMRSAIQTAAEQTADAPEIDDATLNALIDHARRT